MKNNYTPIREQNEEIAYLFITSALKLAFKLV